MSVNSTCERKIIVYIWNKFQQAQMIQTILDSFFLFKFRLLEPKQCIKIFVTFIQNISYFGL